MTMTKELTGEELTAQRVYAAYRRALGTTIQKLLDEPTILEVYRLEDGSLWSDSIINGRQHTGEFLSEEDAESIVDLVADAVGNNTAGYNDPQLAAEMPLTGERFQATLPPITKKICFNIRKHIIMVKSIPQYVEECSMAQWQADFLVWAVKKRLNIMVGGSTGGGKTTLVNALMDLPFFKEYRIFQIENRKELQCNAADIVRILTREEGPRFTTQQAIVIGLRMRPDRFVVGEIREGVDALPYAKASNTGHPGCMATIHCDSATEAFDRMAEVISEVSKRIPHRLIMKALAVVVHIEKVQGVGFRVTEIRVPTKYKRKKEEFKTALVTEEYATKVMSGEVSL
jgi:type IV secretion system protein TrbB